MAAALKIQAKALFDGADDTSRTFTRESTWFISKKITWKEHKQIQGQWHFLNICNNKYDGKERNASGPRFVFSSRDLCD